MLVRLLLKFGLVGFIITICDDNILKYSWRDFLSYKC